MATHRLAIASPRGVGNEDSSQWLAYCSCGHRVHRDTVQRVNSAALAHSIRAQQAGETVA